MPAHRLDDGGAPAPGVEIERHVEGENLKVVVMHPVAARRRGRREADGEPAVLPILRRCTRVE